MNTSQHTHQAVETRFKARFIQFLKVATGYREDLQNGSGVSAEGGRSQAISHLVGMPFPDLH
jgi:hypothetical protein